MATSSATRSSAVSLHIGLNAVDPRHYQGWTGTLNACEADAKDMAAIARSRRMSPDTLLTKSATRARVLSEIRQAAKHLAAGDLFFLTYSGHGGQVPDVTGEEGDKQDETWCLYDGELIDDELYVELSKFRRGVRILVLSDSCHSGTVARVARMMAALPAAAPGMRRKLMPPDVAERVYQANKKFYDGLQRSIAKASGAVKRADGSDMVLHPAAGARVASLAPRFNPALILISGCQDNQTSMDGEKNGAFTEALLGVWQRGSFTGDYRRFHREIVSRLPGSQSPNLFVLGSSAKFLREQPFSVQGQPARRVTPQTAKVFVDGVSFPKRPRRALGIAEVATMPVTAAAFNTAATEAAVVGGSVISFVQGVTAERREAIVNASLLAQLVANKAVSDKTRIYAWYESYFDALANIGWVVQDRGFAEYTESSKNFEAHKAIINVATTLLGPATTALAIVKTTLESLQSMNESSPWITIFNREAQSARAARFQVGLAQQDENGQFFVDLMAFGLQAKATITQVLFFKSKKSKATLRHYSGRVTINTQVLDAIAKDIADKLIKHSADYIKLLPDDL